jgi:predicted short-subunit dehydrogenase-like oxidoreductase (DUF2520 family)
VSNSRLSELNLAVLGAGAMAQALVKALVSIGEIRSIRVWSREVEPAALLCQDLTDSSTHVVAEPDLEQALGSADVLLFCVPDDALELLASRVAKASPSTNAIRVALHLSGYVSHEVLAGLRSANWHVGSWHPLVSVSSIASAEREDVNRFAGVAFAIAGDTEARVLAESLATVLEGRAMELASDESARALYHGAASLLSGGLVTLFDCAERMFAGAVAAEPAVSREALLELLRSTVRNLENGSAANCLTGPIVRGDFETINGHLKVLSRDSALRPKTAEQLYRELSRAMLELVQRRGTLSDEKVASIQALLASDPAVETN